MIEFVESDVVKNNSDSGYTITDINNTTEVLTVSPVLEEELDSGTIVRGWLPTGTEVGDPVENRAGVAKLDGSAFPIQTMDCSIADAPKFLDDEISDSDYITDYAETERSVSGTVSIYFRQDDVHYFYDGINNASVALSMVIGSTAGSIITIAMPTCSMSVPEVADQDPTVALSMPYQALGSSGEDSISIVYTEFPPCPDSPLGRWGRWATTYRGPK